MKKLEVKDLKENFFEAIGKEWMLVTAGTKEKFNTMTASWGGIGWLWNKPVAFVFVRPERYTYEFIEKSDYLTLFATNCMNLLLFWAKQIRRFMQFVAQSPVVIRIR